MRPGRGRRRFAASHMLRSFVPGQLDEGILANPGLHLDGNDATADRHEKVYLTLSAPKVGRHEPRPAAKEKPGGDALAKPA